MSWTRATWFEVVEPVTVLVQVAIYPSNTWYGRSQAYGRVYEEVTLDLGDRVADTPGGHFVRRDDGKWHEANLAPSEKHSFEKVYLPPPHPEWPADHVREIERPAEFERAAVPTQTSGWVYEHARAIGRSIDYIITKED